MPTWPLSWYRPQVFRFPKYHSLGYFTRVLILAYIGAWIVSSFLTLLNRPTIANWSYKYRITNSQSINCTDAGFVYESLRIKTNRVIWDICFHETNPFFLKSGCVVTIRYESMFFLISYTIPASLINWFSFAEGSQRWKVEDRLQRRPRERNDRRRLRASGQELRHPLDLLWGLRWRVSLFIHENIQEK